MQTIIILARPFVGLPAFAISRHLWTVLYMPCMTRCVVRAQMNATAMMHSGVVHHGLFSLEVTPTSSLYALGIDIPMDYTHLVSTNSGGTCFSYNPEVNCTFTCNMGTACGTSGGTCSCPSYNMFASLPYTTAAGACTAGPSGAQEWQIIIPTNDDTLGNGTMTFSYCFLDSVPVYIHQQWHSATAAAADSPILRALLANEASTTDDDSKPPVDVLYWVQAFTTSAPPASDFAPPAYCVCEAN